MTPCWTISWTTLKTNNKEQIINIIKQKTKRVMRTIYRLFTLLIAVCALAACEHDELDANGSGRLARLHTIEYVVANNIAPSTPTTVAITSEHELDSIFDCILDYAESGRVVTFHGNIRRVLDSKDTRTITTTSRTEIKQWMSRMEGQGKTVTVTYDSATRTWHGTAYASSAPLITEYGGRLRIATMTYHKDSTKGYRHDKRFEYRYAWSGYKLAYMEMMETEFRSDHLERITDSMIVRNIATFSYNGNLRTAMQIRSEDGTLKKNFIYTYMIGRLVQEWRWPENKVYTFSYDNDGYLDDQIVTTSDGSRFMGRHCLWNDGDVACIVDENGVLLESFEYDNTLCPRGVTLGTTMLLPDFASHFPLQTQWGRRNLTRWHHAGDDEADDIQISYTYSNGRIATADIQLQDGATVHWTFQFMD